MSLFYNVFIISTENNFNFNIHFQPRSCVKVAEKTKGEVRNFALKTYVVSITEGILFLMEEKIKWLTCGPYICSKQIKKAQTFFSFSTQLYNFLSRWWRSAIRKVFKLLKIAIWITNIPQQYLKSLPARHAATHYIYLRISNCYCCERCILWS